jgi:hypothetical protein
MIIYYTCPQRKKILREWKTTSFHAIIQLVIFFLLARFVESYFLINTSLGQGKGCNFSHREIVCNKDFRIFLIKVGRFRLVSGSIQAEYTLAGGNRNGK